MAARARPRVAVYGIARDEETQLERWVAAARDADVLLLVDTGSADGTPELGRQLGVEVHALELEMFRFDQARNRALALIPDDIDVCLSVDLDEVLGADWRVRLDEVWRSDLSTAMCWMNWRWSPDHSPLRWTVERIHARHGCRWEHPVHERLSADEPKTIALFEIEIEHLRDPSAPRSTYASLLQLALCERPGDARLAHMYANDLRMQGQADEALAWFHRCLELAPPPNERLHSLLMLSHLEPERRELLLLDACAEFPHRREPWCEFGQHHLQQRRFRAALATSQRALSITEPADDYLTNPYAWGPWPDQIAATAAHALAERDWHAHHARRAQAGDRSEDTAEPASSDQPMVNFILVTFRDRAAGARMLEQLRRTVHVPHTLIEIDNSSSNVGWAAASNAAARRGDAELIAFVNQDLTLTDGWLEPILEAFETDANLVIAGPRCVDGLPWPRVPIGLQSWVCGACILVRREFFESVAGFDSERFPHEYAETDLERTAVARGHSISTIEQSEVIHHYEETKSEQVLAWRAQGARNQAMKWGLPLDPWGVAHISPDEAHGEPTALMAERAAPRRAERNPSRVIVSMTTIPSRLPHCSHALDRLLSQSVTDFDLELYLPEVCRRTGERYEPPAELAAYGDRLTVRQITRDYGPATKLLGPLATILEGDEDRRAVITVDDDVLLEPHAIEELLGAAARHPHAALGFMGVSGAHFIHAETIGANGLSHVAVDVLGGYRAVLYPVEVLDRTLFTDLDALTERIGPFLDDDHLFGWNLARRGIPRAVIATHHPGPRHAPNIELLDLPDAISGEGGDPPSVQRHHQELIAHYRTMGWIRTPQSVPAGLESPSARPALQ
jgi:GT2 family glycosyltransferase